MVSVKGNMSMSNNLQGSYVLVNMNMSTRRNIVGIEK